MGRKKKPRAERVCMPITFTCTPCELKEIKAGAKRTRERLSPFCREAVLSHARELGEYLDHTVGPAK